MRKKETPPPGKIEVVSNSIYRIYRGKHRGWENCLVTKVHLIAIGQRKVKLHSGWIIQIQEYTPKELLRLLEGHDIPELGIYSFPDIGILGNYFPLQELDEQKLRTSLLFNAPLPPHFAIRKMPAERLPFTKLF